MKPTKTTGMNLKIPTEWLEKIRAKREQQAAELGHKITQNAFILDLIRKAAND